MEANLMNLIQFAVLAPAQFLVAGLWQGLLLAVVAWIGLKACPKIAPKNRFLLWLNIFVLAALLPFFAAFRAPASGALSHTAAIGLPVPHLSAAWAVALVGLWVLASLFSLARLLWNGYSLWMLSRTAVPVSPEALDPELRSILAKADSRSIGVSLSHRVDSPVVIGFFHRAIVIPEWLSTRLTQPELKQVLLHELAHLERCDDWTNLLQKAVRALFPLNPALILADRQLCREREMACDDAVLDAAITPRAYATCLAALAEKRILRRAESLAPGAWRGRSELAERIHRILTNKRKLGSFGAGPAVAGFSLAFLFVGVVLARCPQLVAFTATSSQSPAPLEARIADARIADAHIADAHIAEARIAPTAKVELASLRTVASPQRHPILPRASKPTAKHRVHTARRLEIKDVDFLRPMKAANGPQVVFTLWERSTPPTAFSGINLDLSVPEFAFFQSHSSWIVIQL
jgi:beta-lactamase regulating signal transducer with metallopeptidase domain